MNSIKIEKTSTANMASGKHQGALKHGAAAHQHQRRRHGGIAKKNNQQGKKYER